MDKSDLAKRMKDYESTSKTKLMKRCPAICRIDGKAHHSFTKGFKRPFDEIYIQSMQETAKYLCENIQGVVLSYQQSDEITLVLVDYKELNTSPYFDYEVQKLCSIIASMATMAFNKFFKQNAENFIQDCATGYEIQGLFGEDTPEYKLCRAYQKAIDKGAMFDARVFNLPKEEVTNCVYWRQLDCSRNSVQMVGQANFSHKELQNKTCNMIQDMLMEQKGINWNNLPTYQKCGTCVVRNKIVLERKNDGAVAATLRDFSKSENEWIIDLEIPLFKGEGRKYIEQLIHFE